MSPHLLAAAILALQAALPAGASLELLPPPTRVARQVVLFAPGYRELARIDSPGDHSVPVPMPHGGTQPLTVRVEALGDSVQADPYREVDPAELAGGGEDDVGRAVRFTCELGQVQEAGPGRAMFVVLPAGRKQPVAAAFDAPGGVTCCVPAGADRLLRVLRLVEPAGDLTVRGRVVRSGSSSAVVLVEGIEHARGAALRDEPPWVVTLHWRERKAAPIARAGERPVRLPVAGAAEAAGKPQHTTVLVRLREFPVADLMVEGRHVAGELAATPERRGWGLQGRAGLGPEEGMLFFFERPLRPQFAMKAVSFPLALAFIRADGTIAEIHRMDPGDRRGVESSVPVNYVLEMERGWFERHGVEPGDRVALP